MLVFLLLPLNLQPISPNEGQGKNQQPSQQQIKSKSKAKTTPPTKNPPLLSLAKNLPEAKLPPQVLEAEQALLGGLLLENRRLDQIVDEVVAGDFYDTNHRLIFEAICELQAVGDAADVVTVAQRLENFDHLEKIGGVAYLASLANNTPSAANIVTYAKLVREKAILRNLIIAASDISERAYAPEGKPAREVLEYAEKLIFEISKREDRSRAGFISMSPLVRDAVAQIEERYESQEAITGIATGYADLDEETSGLQRGDLIIIAGRPSMGKTAFALNIAEYAVIKQKLTVAMFSMEMPGEQLAMRLLSSVGRVNLKKVRNGQLNDDDWSRLTSTSAILSGASMFIDSSANLNPLELRSKCRRLSSTHGPVDMIVVDYIQLMEASAYNENRATELSAITRALKMLAMELKVPVVALSQLNRSLEQRPNKRPVMSDLRESGAIEQDADVILFIYRDEVYKKDSEDKGKAEVIIGKQRNGPIGTVTLAFRGEFTRFENYTAIDYPPPPNVGPPLDDDWPPIDPM